MKIHQGLVLQQKLTITQTLLQSIELLQMDQLEISEYVNNLVCENPTIDIVETPSNQEVLEEIRKQFIWTNIHQDKSYYSAKQSDDWSTYNDFYSLSTSTDELNSLDFFLRDQVERLHLSATLRKTVLELINFIDDKGFLSQEDIETAKNHFNIKSSILEKSLDIIRNLEPFGIGSLNATDFLRRQAENDPDCNPITIEIIKDSLDKLAKKQFNSIAKTHRCTIEDVQNARDYIIQLDPFPILDFNQNRTTNYVVPDAYIIIAKDNKPHIIFTEYFQPEIRINPYYKELLKNVPDKETKKYLKAKIQEAHAIELDLLKRKDTFKRCLECIVEHQYDFFVYGKELKPLIQQEIAEQMNVNASTVSRTIKGKYIQIKSGTYPLKYFFQRSVADYNISTDDIKKEIARLINSEDKTKPLSDATICKILKESNISIPRRTIAKYRMQLGFPGTSERVQKMNK